MMKILWADKRLRIVGVALAALLLLAAAWRWWPGATPPPPREALTIGVAQVLHSLPIIVAQERGFFDKEGLDVTFQPFPSGRMALEAMLRGEVEVADVAQTPVVMQGFQRRDFVVIASFLPDLMSSKLVVPEASTIRSATDLKGRRVGIAAGTSAHFFLYVLLSDEGLGMGDVVAVPLSPPDMADALAAGAVDAIAIFEPYASQAMRKVAGRLMTTDRANETMSYATLRGFPQQRSHAVQALLRATDGACGWIRGHPQEALAIAARQFKLDEDVLQGLWPGVRPALGLDQTYLLSLEEQARWALQTGLVKAAAMPNYLELLDPSALDAVKPHAVTVIR